MAAVINAPTAMLTLPSPPLLSRGPSCAQHVAWSLAMLFSKNAHDVREQERGDKAGPSKKQKTKSGDIKASEKEEEEKASVEALPAFPLAVDLGAGMTTVTIDHNTAYADIERYVMAASLPPDYEVIQTYLAGARDMVRHDATALTPRFCLFAIQVGGSCCAAAMLVIGLWRVDACGRNGGGCRHCSLWPDRVHFWSFWPCSDGICACI